MSRAPFRIGRVASLADCAPSGRVRLDALARWLQDVAYEDVEDAGLALSAVWVVRRTQVSVRRFPRFAERVELATHSSRVGRAWAERRTTLGAGGEAVALWVHLDSETWRPAPFSQHELAVYDVPESAGRLSARLRHPIAPERVEREYSWSFRAAECDIAGHVNNAAYLTVLEEELLRESRPEPDALEVEIEYRAPAQPGEHRVLVDGARRWIVGPGGELHASIVFS